MYRAKITKKELVRGVLRAEVTFSDGKDTFTDSFEVSQAQSGSWLGEHIVQRLGHLNSLPALGKAIVLGDFEPAEKTEEEIYKEKASAYGKYMDIARLGVIPSDRPIIKELREWLKENFKDEYVTFF